VLVCASCGHENSEDAKFCEECGFSVAVAAGVKEQRKTVTVLFCDVVGSTALGESTDPEALRALLARYFDRMKAIVERHGGSVEKFIGDAVMAVFGVPVVHEDDALRALRAAVEMRDALPELGLQGRIGVMTGEVVTGTEERLATGDAVNVAARLEQAAEPGEVLIGQPTLALVGGAVEVEPVEPLGLKGKAEPVPAYRLLRVRETPERLHGGLFVGRERELAIVREAWERVQAEQRCELITLVGDAGVGKSRLVAEVLASVEATIVRARCLPYGEGITYWPVVEVLKQLDLLPAEEAAAAAIRSLLGQTEAATSAEEIAWAFRKTLEHASAERPLVVVFDDIQWGEEMFLDLIEHVALLSSGASILLLCIARLELTECRLDWPVTLRLEPLRDEDVEELIPERIAGELRERIARAAGGNPLFIGEMLAMAQETEGDVVVPPTLKALLAARLDQLETAERSVLERGAIEGEIFHRGAVQALAPEETQVTPRLAALVRKELIRPDTPQLAGEDGFRFRHLLIRDAAYDALPKATRAELHERFAVWLEGRGAELVELDEILGYHLEQACRYRQELGQVDPHGGALAARAGERLGLAGRRAILRQDFRAGLNLLQRAADLLSDELRDARFEIDLGWARFNTGQGAEAVSGLAEAAGRAGASGNRIAELGLRLEQANLESVTGPSAERLRELAAEALPVFEAAGDEWGLTVACGSLLLAEELQARSQADIAAAAERVVGHARRADDRVWVDWGESQLVHAQYYGATPVEECLRWLDEHPDVERRRVLPCRDRLLAMLGRFDEAHRLLAGVDDRVAELGAVRFRTGLALRRFDIAMLEGDTARAELAARETCETAQATAELGNFMWYCCNLAQALHELGRDDEAEEWLERGRETAPSDEPLPQMRWRQVRAKVLARRGEHAEAERLAREAVAVCEETDMLDAQGDVYADLAEVLSLAGRPKEAAEALEQALERYERKGNRVSAQRAQARLAEPVA
jgi:class 3 adenylate cyclase/tetratricopeptide (TPR) repeat protein